MVVGRLTAFKGNAPLYGHYTSLLPSTPDGYLYLYATLNNTNSGASRGLGLARAPIGSINSNTTYEFYLPATQTWAPYPPPSIGDSIDVLGKQGKNSGANVGTGDIFYSPQRPIPPCLHARHLATVRAAADKSMDDRHQHRPDELGPAKCVVAKRSARQLLQLCGTRTTLAVRIRWPPDPDLDRLQLHQLWTRYQGECRGRHRLVLISVRCNL